MVPGPVHKVPCPFPKGEALVHLPGKTDENIANAAYMLASFGESVTFGEPKYPTPWNSIIPPIKGKVLPSPIKFTAQSRAASHPIGVDRYLENCICQALTHVQHTSTHDPAITSPDEPLN